MTARVVSAQQFRLRSAVAAELPEDTRESCDGCGNGIPARWEIMLATGKILTMCNHHKRELDALR